MDKELVHELLAKAKNLATTDQLKGLVEAFQGFLEIQEEKLANPDNLELTTKWLSAREKVLGDVDLVAREYGITPEFIREQLKESNLFSGEQRKLYETIRNEANRK